MFYQVKDKNTAQTFKNVLNDGNIMVLYYADWCGYCQQFKPVWEDLKKKMKKGANANLCHLGEVESSNMHHLPDVEVKSYPTILFYKHQKQIPKKEEIKNKKHQSTLPSLDEKKENITNTKPINSFQELIQSMMNKTQEKGEDSKDNVVPFEEERSIDNLLTFIRKNADKKVLISSKKKVKQLDKSKPKSKPAMVNLTKKIAMIKDSKSKTKKNKMTKVSKKQVKNKKTSNNTQSLKEYKNAKKNDKTIEKEIMNSFKNEI